MARKERQIDNYFWCVEIEASDGCPRDLTGNVLCDGCECLNSCTYCGRKNTSFCNRCESNRNNCEVDTNELYIF